MALFVDPSVHSTSEIVDIANVTKGNENLEVNSLPQGGVDDESTIYVPSIGDSDNNSEASSNGQKENDLASDNNSETPSNGQMENDLTSYGNSEAMFNGQIENDDLTSDIKKLAPVATSAEVGEVSSHESEGSGSPSNLSEEEMKRIHIDTKKPFDSVKSAVSKFGGIVDWKAHKFHTVEKSKVIEQELEKVQEDIPQHKEQVEIAEQSKNKMLKDLESMKIVIEELKLNLESAQTEEHQAKQDCQVAQQRVEEMEQEIAQEDSVAAKTQLEVAKARYAAAVTDLKAVRDELECLRTEYVSLISEKNAAEKKAEEAISLSKEMEQNVEKLTAELISIKECVESTQVAYLEDEEKRTASVLAREQELLNWANDLKKAEEDLEKLDKQIESAKDLRSKFDIASSLLKELKAELVAYMDAKVNEEKNGDKSDTGTHVAIAATYKELEEVKFRIEKATDEVSCLKETSVSLGAELEEEKLELAKIKEREDTFSNVVSSLEDELVKTKSEVAGLQMVEKEASEKIAELRKNLQCATEDAEEAKSAANLAHQELKNAEEEAVEAKATVSKIDSRLLVAHKEKEVAQSTQKLAVDAMKVLKRSEATLTTNDEDSNDQVTISSEEYYELSKRAHEAEERANKKVTAAKAKVEVEKESESKTLKQLEEVNREVEQRKEALRSAKENAEKAKEVKLAVEQELRKWRAEHELRRKAAELAQVSVNSPSKGIEEVQGMKGMDPAMGQGLRIEKVVETSSPLVAYGQGLGLKTLEQIASFAGSTHYSSPKAKGPSPKADGTSPKAEGLSLKGDLISPKAGGPSSKGEGASPKADGVSPKATLGQSNTIKKKKRSFFPRFFMFFTRRRSKQS